VSLTLSVNPSEAGNHYVVDGLKLVNPLYHSPTHGYMLVYQPHLQRAAEPESYLLKHPHRPLLDQTFREMAALASQFQFKVTVVIAPTSNRLYAPYFDNLAEVTREPYFVNYLLKLSKEAGFAPINLLKEMQPYSEKELLYFRDDDHWNERGGQVAAEIMKQHLIPAVTARGSKHPAS